MARDEMVAMKCPSTLFDDFLSTDASLDDFANQLIFSALT